MLYALDRCDRVEPSCDNPTGATTTDTDRETSGCFGDHCDFGTATEADANADFVWEGYFRKLFSDSNEHDTIDLLKLYGCPLYSDKFGVRYEEETAAAKTSDAAAAAATVSADASPPYSRIPTEDDTWKVFEEAYYFAVGMEAPTPSSTVASTVASTAESSASELQPEQQPNRHPHPVLGGLRGMQIPYEIRYDTTIGRTIHATEFVPSGTIVWSPTHTATFTSPPTAAAATTTAIPRRTTTTASNNNATTQNTTTTKTFPTYRRFLDYLYRRNQNHDDSSTGGGQHNWVCDALMWTNNVSGNDNSKDNDNDNSNWESQHSYTVTYESSLCLAFDHGSLFNDAKGDTSTENLENGLAYELNNGFGLEGHPSSMTTTATTAAAATAATTTNKIKLTPSTCQVMYIFASRDIQPGEGDYDDDDSGAYDDDDDQVVDEI
eukprot:jgi/Psemu1/18694/gm1.18694_g